VLQISQLGTPAHHDSDVDDTRAPLMQPAPGGAAHDKLTSKRVLAYSGLPAFATRIPVCLSPASNGSNVPGMAMFA
jgi:hypothetical protein